MPPLYRLYGLRGSQKYLVVLRLGKVLLQHLHMGQKRLVVKILGALGAFADAPLALDAGAGHIGHVLRVDGAHGTQSGTGTAVGTPGQISLGLCLQKLGGLTVSAHGDIVGGARVTGDFDRRRGVR